MPIIGVPNPNDGSAPDKQAFIDGMSTPISHVLDRPGDIWHEHGILSQPSWVFVAADGSVDVLVGSLGPQGLVDRLESL